MTRFIILHHHIFKNAGSTLDSVLAREFNDDFIEFHTDASDSGRVYPGQLMLFLDKRPNVKAVSSHHFFGCDFDGYLDYVQRYRYSFVDFILLRHPISRLVSIYLYYRGLPEDGSHPLQLAAKSKTFVEYLRYVMDKHPNFAINPQVTMLGCRHYGAPPSTASFDAALERLISVTGLGVVEKYDVSMITAEYLLQPIFPGLQLHGKSQNVSSRESIPNYDGSLESIEAAVGGELYGKICKLNDLDIQLWSTVSQEIGRRVSYVPNFDERANEFKSRSMGRG